MATKRDFNSSSFKIQTFHGGAKSSASSNSDAQYYNFNLGQSYQCSKLDLDHQEKCISKHNNDIKNGRKFYVYSHRRLDSMSVTATEEFWKTLKDFAAHQRMPATAVLPIFLDGDGVVLQKTNTLVFWFKTAALKELLDSKKDDSYERNLWNNSGKKGLSSIANLRLLFEKEENKRWKKNGENSSAKNSSTLSLHIAAYESYIETSDSNMILTDDKMDTEKFGKKSLKDVKLAPAALVASEFEIPRQQDDSPRSPEIMQFKSSQKLLTLNVGGSPKPKTSEKDGIGFPMALLSPRRFFESRITPNANQSIHCRPKENSSKSRKGLVIECNEQYGRILCSRSFSDLGVFVFFDRNTNVNGTPLCLSDIDLVAAVPLGVEVDFKVTYGFPSMWRTFGTYMGYYCETLKYDCTQHVTMFHTELLAQETRHDGLVIGYDGEDGKAVIHPHIWPSPNTIRKLYTGAELEPKKNHRFQVLTQQSRTLLALVRPVPSFLKGKLRRMKYIALSAQPLSTTVVCYAFLVGIGPTELLFDSIGVRDDTGDNVPAEIVMDRNLFLSSIGFDKAQGAKVDLVRLIGQAFQLGCVKNLKTQRHQLRAFCAYLCNNATLPRNPRVPMPREYSRNLRKASTNLKALPSPFLEKKTSKLDTSMTRRSFYKKFNVRRSYRANPRKRAFTPCSPYTDLTAKRKNLNESMHDVSLSDF